MALRLVSLQQFLLSVSPDSGPPGTVFTFTVTINEPAAANTPVTLTIQARVAGSAVWIDGESKTETIGADGTLTTTFQAPVPNAGLYEARVKGVIAVQEAYTNTVSFTVTAVAQVSLVITAGLGGTTDPAPGTYYYDAGTTVTVKAISDNGYKFKHWLINGGIIDPYSHQNPTSAPIISDSTLEAVFEEGEEPKPFPWPLVVAAVGVTAVIIIVVVAAKKREG
ncbi:hypothetical protein ES702_02196 [subsurface metagenome]